MNFTFDRSGTGQQVQWVKEAIQACSYDLSVLTDYNVTVVWEDPLPLSDSGHLHSYMVTTGADKDWTIHIEKWADDPTNPNNQGLPDPSNDIFGFYRESFVHELGHVVSESLINSTLLVQQACSLFWTPDMNGGSGLRYGTVNDWDPTAPWAELIKEAVAEQFKIVYYTGQLIFRNRTVWRLPAKNWPDLWDLLVPPFRSFWTNVSAEGGLSGSGSVTVNSSGDPGGIQNLTHTSKGSYAALGAFEWGPATQPAGTPPAPNNPGGNYQWQLSIIVFDPTNPGVTDTLASMIFVGSINLSNEPFPEGAPFNRATVSCNVYPNISLVALAPASTGAQLCQIGVKPTGTPDTYQVDFITGEGLIASGIVVIPEGHNALALTFSGGQSQAPIGYADMQAGQLAWIESAAFTPPPYPGGPEGGDIAVGLGFRGAVILGQ